MAVKFNENKEIVKAIKEGLEKLVAIALVEWNE